MGIDINLSFPIFVSNMFKLNNKNMVQDYNLQCNYQIGTLKDKIYLLPYDNTVSINYKVDNNQINVTDIKYQWGYYIEGDNVILNETESYDDRFKFATTITIDIKEGLYSENLRNLDLLRNKKWYVIVENHENKQFIGSIDFPMEFEYTYSFSSSNIEPHTNTFTFNGLSNIPVLIIDKSLGETNITGLYNKTCFYNTGEIKDLKICNFKNSLIKTNEDGFTFDNILTNGREVFHKVEYIKNTFMFTEQYKDNKFTSTLTFSIPLSQYKFIFHYNLIEFKKNRYTVVFRTSNNNAFASGFEFGFFPSYTIQTSEEINTPNMITITLKHVGDYPLLYSRKNDDQIYVVDDRIVYVPQLSITNDNGTVMDTEVCINETQSIKTLLMEQTITGELTDNYWVLDGYEDIYSFLNIVGVYTKDTDMGLQLISNSSKCSKESANECQFEVSPPTNLTFYVTNQTKEFILKGACDWQFTESPSFVDVTPTSGLANENVLVSVVSNKNPGDTIEQGIIEVTTGNLKREIIVTLEPLGDWLSPDIFNITAERQTVSSYSTVSIANLEIVNSGGCIINFQGNVVNIIVPENLNETTKVLTVTIKNNLNGLTKDIIINQDKLYVDWLWLNSGDIVCDGIVSYQRLTKFKGYTPSTINIETSETKQGDKILDNDSRCYTNLTEWRKSEKTICENGTLYSIEEEYLSIDGGKTWNLTGNIRKDKTLEINSPSCDNRYTWVNNGKTICVSGNLYQQLEKYFNNGNNIIPTGETKVGNLIEIQSPSCLEPESNYIKYTFWYHRINTSSPLYNLKIQSSTNFTINWGDGTSNSYLASDYETLNVCSHTWTKATPTSGSSWGEYTVVISGGIINLTLEKPDTTLTTDFYYAAIDVSQGSELRYIDINTTRLKTNSIDLTNCDKLISFKMVNNYDIKGLTSFVFPTYSDIRYLRIGNENFNIQSYITTPQLQNIVDNLPSYTGEKYGLIDLCYNPDGKGNEYGCSINETPIEAKQWTKSNVCCRTTGAKQYRLFDTGGTICDSANHIKYTELKLQYCTYNAETGYWSNWADVTPIQLFYGDIVEYDSPDCGGVKEQFKWEVRNDLYECDGVTSYYQEQKYVSTNGVNWIPVVPEEFRRGALRKTNDSDCGYTPPILPLYKFNLVPGEYNCSDNPNNGYVPSSRGGIKFTLFKPTRITIPFSGFNMKVDWGDGTTSIGDNNHDYTTDGIFTVEVTGVVNRMGSFGETSRRLAFQDALIRFNSWGDNVAVTIVSDDDSAMGIFSYCKNLAVCADDSYGVLKNITRFYGMFNNCVSLYGHTLRIDGIEIYMYYGKIVDKMYCSCTNLSNYRFLVNKYPLIVSC